MDPNTLWPSRDKKFFKKIHPTQLLFFLILFLASYFSHFEIPLDSSYLCRSVSVVLSLLLCNLACFPYHPVCSVAQQKTSQSQRSLAVIQGLFRHALEFLSFLYGAKTANAQAEWNCGQRPMADSSSQSWRPTALASILLQPGAVNRDFKYGDELGHKQTDVSSHKMHNYNARQPTPLLIWDAEDLSCNLFTNYYQYSSKLPWKIHIFYSLWPCTK